jgi:hypothetical protein
MTPIPTATKIKRTLAFIAGVFLTTAPFWIFTYYVRCEQVDVPYSLIAYACNDTANYTVPILCTLAWPFVIGGWLVLYSLDMLTDTSEAVKRISNNDQP